MVNPVSSGVSTAYVTPQPSFTNGAEARVNPEQVQPRQAPAAETQRNDQKLSNRDEDNRRSEVRAESSPRSESSEPSSRRGENLDVTV